MNWSNLYPLQISCISASSSLNLVVTFCGSVAAMMAQVCAERHDNA